MTRAFSAAVIRAGICAPKLSGFTCKASVTDRGPAWQASHLS